MKCGQSHTNAPLKRHEDKGKHKMHLERNLSKTES